MHTHPTMNGQLTKTLQAKTPKHRDLPINVDNHLGSHVAKYVLLKMDPFFTT